MQNNFCTFHLHFISLPSFTASFCRSLFLVTVFGTQTDWLFQFWKQTPNSLKSSLTLDLREPFTSSLFSFSPQVTTLQGCLSKKKRELFLSRFKLDLLRFFPHLCICISAFAFAAKLSSCYVCTLQHSYFSFCSCSCFSYIQQRMKNDDNCDF